MTASSTRLMFGLSVNPELALRDGVKGGRHRVLERAGKLGERHDAERIGGSALPQERDPGAAGAAGASRSAGAGGRAGAAGATGAKSSTTKGAAAAHAGAAGSTGAKGAGKGSSKGRGLFRLGSNGSAVGGRSGNNESDERGTERDSLVYEQDWLGEDAAAPGVLD